MEGYVQMTNAFVGNKRIGKASAALLVDFCYHLEKLYPIKEAVEQPRALDGDTCAACGDSHVVPAVYCMKCGFALPPRQ